jgi:DNA sulfur modification protein DndD
MRFKKIILNNLFSYFRDVSFDLDGANNQANIVLISGRNGFGKTSFIRCLKLLFSGTEAPLVLSLTGRNMTPKQFVMGDGRTWLGIMNRKAAQRGETRCHVSIEWEEEGNTVIATRSWDLNSTYFPGDLKIRTKKDSLSDINAREFLDQRLPSAYIPFFFFDSEQIERLVDATDGPSFKNDMEQLLDIAPIDYLREELKKVAKEWHRDAMEEKNKQLLLEVQEQLKHEELAIAVEDEKQQDLEYQKGDLEQEIKELENELKSLEYLQNRQDVEKLKAEKDTKDRSREEMIILLADLIRKESPLLANPDLVEKAGKHLAKAAGNRLGEAAEILESLKLSLVPGLLEEPPYPSPELEPGQKRFLKKRLIGLIDARIPDTDTGLFSLDLKTAKHLHEQFLEYRGMASKRGEIRRLLAQIHELTRDIAAIEFEMSEAVGLTDEEKERLDFLNGEYRDKIEKIGAVKSDIEQSRTRKEVCRKKVQQLKKDIRTQEKAVALSIRTKEKVYLAQDLRKFFNTFKSNLKKARKDEVEKALNEYIKILIPNLPQVKRIAVSDTFGLTYLDGSGIEVGRSSLSSGNKQLIATALLWALKTVSQKDVPVVIDTPLGRLDADNQKGLLEKYYPRVGEQVILLPTDSELDEEKYRLISPYVYKEYRLKNDDGESTQIEEGSMYPVG